MSVVRLEDRAHSPLHDGGAALREGQHMPNRCRHHHGFYCDRVVVIRRAIAVCSDMVA